MKSKLLLLLIACCLGIGSVSAQCSAHFTHQQSASGGWVNFYVDNYYISPNYAPFFDWNFGDGTSGTGSQVAHQYTDTVGSHVACLTLHDSASLCTFTICDTISLTSIGHQCSANISFTQADSTFAFSSAPSGTAPFSYVWTVDGQTVSTAPDTTLLLRPSLAQYYRVCVQITDSFGCVATDCRNVSDTLAQCYAFASLTAQQDSTYTFGVSAVGAGSNTYVWTYDNTTISTGSTASLVLDSAALLLQPTVCVAVTNAVGCVATDCLHLGGTPTGGGGCQAYFVISPDSIAGHYTGVNLSTGSFGTDIQWSFGDGSTSTDLYPTHTYAAPGQYIICLTVGVYGTSCLDSYCDSSFYTFKTAGGQMTQLTITAPAATGVKDIADDASISIYPNPVNDVLNIRSSARVTEQKIYDTKGQLMIDIKTPADQINVSKLSAGIYVLELNHNGAYSRRKFVKQ